MTPTNKKQRAQDIAVEGHELVNKAETLLEQVVLRNARLSQEMKQTRAELEEKLARKNR